jgi:hypothetical protein
MEVSVSFTPRPLYPQGNITWYPLDRRLGGPQSRSGRGGEENNSQPPSGTELKNPDRPSRSPALYRLSYHGSHDIEIENQYSYKFCINHFCLRVLILYGDRMNLENVTYSGCVLVKSIHRIVKLTYVTILVWIFLALPYRLEQFDEIKLYDFLQHFFSFIAM